MTISVNALTFDAVIGILDFERETPQRVQIDAAIGYTFDQKTYIDYAEVTALIKSTIIKGRFGLIEEALETLQKTLKTAFPLIDTLSLSITKPDILPDATVTLSEQYKF
jgi:dihydroneopterin aldolase